MRTLEAIRVELDRLELLETDPDRHQDDQAQAGAARQALQWALGEPVEAVSDRMADRCCTCKRQLDAFNGEAFLGDDGRMFCADHWTEEA